MGRGAVEEDEVRNLEPCPIRGAGVGGAVSI